jgi:hypothetical protein
MKKSVFFIQVGFEQIAAKHLLHHRLRFGGGLEKR